MSYVYLQCLKRAFEAEGYDVKLRIGGNPDEDFFFMTCARAIVVSGGGFSRHAGKIVERRGGVQVGRVFNMDGPPPNAKRAHVRERRREKLAEGSRASVSAEVKRSQCSSSASDSDPRSN